MATGTFGNYTAPSLPTGYNFGNAPSDITGLPNSVMNQAFGVARLPYQQYGGSRIADVMPEQQQAWQMISQRATQGDPSMRAATGLLNDTIGGKYMDPSSNPYLQQTYDLAANRMADAYARGTAAQTASAFNRAGAFGGSAMQETNQANNQAFGDSLANLGNQVFGGNYQQERARQLQAGAMAPQFANQAYQDAAALSGVGQEKAQRDQNILNMNYADWLEAKQYPYQQLGLLTPLAGMGTNAQQLAQQGSQYNQQLQMQQQAQNEQNRRAQMQGLLGGAIGGYQFANQAGINPWLGAIGGGLLGAMF